MIRIRPMRPADLPALLNINATFISNSILEVEKTGEGMEVGWRLVERPLERPFNRRDDYNLRPQDLKDVEARLKRDDTLMLVAEDADADGRVVAMLDMETQHWNNTAWLWTIHVDVDYRGQGIGRALLERAADWCAARGLRAIVLETQTNNINACRFYAHIGCFLTGINDTYYSNRDLEAREVALFWAYPVNSSVRGFRR